MLAEKKCTTPKFSLKSSILACTADKPPRRMIHDTAPAATKPSVPTSSNITPIYHRYSPDISPMKRFLNAKWVRAVQMSYTLVTSLCVDNVLLGDSRGGRGGESDFWSDLHNNWDSSYWLPDFSEKDPIKNTFS